MIRAVKCFLSLGLAVLILVWCLSVGVVDISWLDTGRIAIDILFNELKDEIPHDVIYYLRLPRLVLAFEVGMGLALAGCIMQAVLRNPLADPYILGISSGASLGAVAAIVLGLSQVAGLEAVGFFAFVGAVAVSTFIIGLGQILYRNSSLSLLLLGVAINGVCSACVSLIITLFGDTENIRSILFWMMGSLTNASWETIEFLALVVLPLSFLFLTQYRSLNLMLLGDEAAITLGKNLTRVRQGCILMVAVMVGALVNSVGMVGFVGLIVPHFCRAVVGSNHLYLVPMAAVMGGVFLVFADVCGKLLVTAGEMPIGIVASIIGAPLLLYILSGRFGSD